MANEIRADYDQLEQIASQFNNAAQAIGEMDQKVAVPHNKLCDGGWIGQGFDAYVEEMIKVLHTDDRLKEALEQAGQTVQQIAKSLRQAEEQASSLFRH